MFRVAVLEYVEKERAVVNAWTEQHHIGLRVRRLNEIACLRGAQIGFDTELRREKPIERLFVQWFTEQEPSNRPVLVPVGALVGRVVQNFEAGIQFLA